jgi:tRNA pseudouridine55 synthase
MCRVQKVLNLYKKIGETPLERIERFQEENLEYKKEKMTYAGRLDPLAEGVLLVLVGNEVHKREEYQEFPKEYEFTFLLGVETDSYDILGIPKDEDRTNQIVKIQDITEGMIQTVGSELVGENLFEYPPFSSRTVGGKPLFWWARQGRLHEIEIPKRLMKVHSFRVLNKQIWGGESLKRFVKERVCLVKGDFRQKEILDSWDIVLDNKIKMWEVFNAHVKCSSGTYVRTLVYEMGKKLGCGAVTLHIKRRAVGSFILDHSI